jgi:hypothetical protein
MVFAFLHKNYYRRAIIMENAAKISYINIQGRSRLERKVCTLDLSGVQTQTLAYIMFT